MDWVGVMTTPEDGTTPEEGKAIRDRRRADRKARLAARPYTARGQQELMRGVYEREKAARRERYEEAKQKRKYDFSIEAPFGEEEKDEEATPQGAPAPSAPSGVVSPPPTLTSAQAAQAQPPPAPKTTAPAISVPDGPEEPRDRPQTAPATIERTAPVDARTQVAQALRDPEAPIRAGAFPEAQPDRFEGSKPPTPFDEETDTQEMPSGPRSQVAPAPTDATDPDITASGTGGPPAAITHEVPDVGEGAGPDPLSPTWAPAVPAHAPSSPEEPVTRSRTAPAAPETPETRKGLKAPEAPDRPEPPIAEQFDLSQEEGIPSTVSPLGGVSDDQPVQQTPGGIPFREVQADEFPHGLDPHAEAQRPPGPLGEEGAFPDEGPDDQFRVDAEMNGGGSEELEAIARLCQQNHEILAELRTMVDGLPELIENSGGAGP